MRGSLQLLAIGFIVCSAFDFGSFQGWPRPGLKILFLSSPRDIPCSALEKSFVFEPYWVTYAVLNESLVNTGNCCGVTKYEQSLV